MITSLVTWNHGSPASKSFGACRRSQIGKSASTAWRYLLLLGAALLLLASAASAQTNWGSPVWSDEFNGAVGVFTPTSSNNQFLTLDTGQGVFGTGAIEDMISDGTTSFLDGNGHLVIKTYLSGSTYFSARMKT